MQDHLGQLSGSSFRSITVVIGNQVFGFQRKMDNLFDIAKKLLINITAITS